MTSEQIAHIEKLLAQRGIVTVSVIPEGSVFVQAKGGWFEVVEPKPTHSYAVDTGDKRPAGYFHEPDASEAVRDSE